MTDKPRNATGEQNTFGFVTILLRQLLSADFGGELFFYKSYPNN